MSALFSLLSLISVFLKRSRNQLYFFMHFCIGKIIYIIVNLIEKNFNLNLLF
jgi:hypothetical protein